MQLELAIATSCEPSGCRVVLADGRGAIETKYGVQVLNRIKVRSGDLVAVDLEELPPAIVWRWWHGTVRRVEEERVLVERCVTHNTAEAPATDTLWAKLPAAVRGHAAVGNTVFFSGHRDGEAVVVDVAGPSMPADPQRLRTELLPGVVTAYQAFEG